jgi:hypothetical protein
MRLEPDDLYTRIKYHMINWFVLITLLEGIIRLIAAKFGVFY